MRVKAAKADRAKAPFGIPRGQLVLLGARVGSGVVMIGVALLGWHAFHWPSSLNIAITLMGSFVVLEEVGSFSWMRARMTARQEEAALRHAIANPYVDAAKVAITTQGVVLGLISFSGLSHVDVTVKVGAASLVVGVLIASAMYLLVARIPPITKGQHTAAALLLSLLLYALGFGLICVVAGSWSHR